MKVYWHTLPEAEKKRQLGVKRTVGTFLRKYRRPAWCSNGDAIGPLPFGCFSLMGCNGAKVESIQDCHRCEFVKKSSGRA